MDPALETELVKVKRRVVERVHEKRGVKISPEEIDSIQLDSPLDDHSPRFKSPPPRHDPKKKRAIHLFKKLGVLLLWTPSGLWGFYVATSDGRHTFGQASFFEWIVFWALILAPYFVIRRWTKTGSD